MQVQELMSKNPVLVETKEPVSCAAQLMRSRNIGVMPVCDGRGRLVGMLTDRDITIRCVAAKLDPSSTPVEDIMSRGAVTAEPEEDVQQALEKMHAEQIRRLPVVREGMLVGMLSLADVARNHSMDMEAARALSAITSNICRK